MIGRRKRGIGGGKTGVAGSGLGSRRRRGGEAGGGGGVEGGKKTDAPAPRTVIG